VSAIFSSDIVIPSGPKSRTAREGAARNRLFKNPDATLVTPFIYSQFMKTRTPRAAKQNPATNRLTRVGMLAAWVSIGSFFYYVRRDEILMLGDSVAHINIARRVFDSLDPGLAQLGTVWLPLPHLLMIPFLLSDKMWQSGIGGSIPSMVAYVFGVVGIFRLVGILLEGAGGAPPDTQMPSSIAALVYAANPNLIYMQSTALTEPLYLAFFIWAVVSFAEFVAALQKAEWQQSGPEVSTARRALFRCGMFVACAELTRYDGWFLGGVMGALIAAIGILHWKDRILRWSALKLLTGISLAPILWLVYNAAIYGNPFEFANGPYSAKAIERRVAAPNPAAHKLWAAVSYFLKSAQITLAVGNWGRFWLLAAAIATVAFVWKLRRRAMVGVVILLWSPVVFYSLSLAYGSVPLHVPMWWPFAIFNQRFGLELLPLFAVSAGLLVASASATRIARHQWQAAGAAVLLIVASYTFVWAAKPLCWQEAWQNWERRRGLDMAVQLALREFPPNSRFLMDITEHVGIMERLGIPLRRVVNNEDHRPWIRPSDPHGAWERALADPGRYVDFVIAFEDDLVDKSVNRTNLKLLEVIHSTESPPARIYEAQSPAKQAR
jgi:hypothetical protein